jgi:hypothetical protein
MAKVQRSGRLIPYREYRRHTNASESQFLNRPIRPEGNTEVALIATGFTFDIVDPKRQEAWSE